MTHKIKLATVCQQIRGVSYTPKDMAEIPTEGYIPILRANNIQEKLVFNELVYVNANKISEIQLLKGGDIVVCASSGSKNLVGKAARFVSSPVDQVSFGAFCKVVRPRNIDASYLSHFFNSSYYRNTISKIAQGASINNIRNEHLDNLDINVPTPSEQKRLAERLYKVQELIAKQKEQIAKLDLLIKSRFLDMFGDPITNPKNWPLFPLGKFISISGGFAFPSSEFKESGLPIVRIGNINSGVFKDDHFVFYQENEKLRKYLVYPDDLVLSLTGTVGKDDYANICFIGKKYARYYLNQRNAKLVLTSNLDKTFIWQIFKSPEIKKRLTSLNRGVRQANISNQDILNLKVIYPDLFLQTQFANFVKSVEQQKEVFSARLSNLEVLYKSLMQEYFG